MIFKLIETLGLPNNSANGANVHAKDTCNHGTNCNGSIINVRGRRSLFFDGHDGVTKSASPTILSAVAFSFWHGKKMKRDAVNSYVAAKALNLRNDRRLAVVASGQ